MKFTDYFKPKWKHSDSNIRAEAIKDLDVDYNLDELVSIVISDSDIDNQKIALKKINDEDSLQKIIQMSTETVIRDSAGKKLDTIRVKQVGQTNSMDEALNIIEKIENIKHIEELALSNNNLVVREKCFAKLSHSSSFFKIAMKEKTSDLAVKAFHKVSNPAHIKNLAKKATIKAVRILAQEAISKNAKDRGADSERKVALAKLELLVKQYSSLLPTTNWSESCKKARDIEEAWDSLIAKEPAVDSGIFQQFNEVKDEFSRQFAEFSKRQQEKDNKEMKVQEALDIKKDIYHSLSELWGSAKGPERDEQIKNLISRWDAIKLPADLEEGAGLNNQYLHLLQKIRNEQGASEPAETPEVSRVKPVEEQAAALLEEAQSLLEAGDNVDVRHTWAEIQKNWKKLGGLDSDERNEKFEDLSVKIGTVIEIYDKKQLIVQKENLEKMRLLIPELEALVDNPDLVSAEKQLRDISNKWKSLTSFGQPNDEIKAEYGELVNKFQLASDQFKEAQEWLRWANLKKKQELCEKLEELISNTTESKELFEKFKELQNEWKSIGPVSWDSTKEVWDKYRRLTDDLYERCEDYFTELEEERITNLKKKEELCEIVEKQADIKNWKESSEIIKDAQAKWKDIGPVPKDDSDRIWERFRNTCDLFFNSRKAYFSVMDKDKDENLQKKLELCELLESHQDSSSWKDTTEIFKKAQEDWKEIGLVPKENIQEVWERFRTSCDYFFNRRSEYFKQLEGEKEGNLEKKKALIDQVEHLDEIESDSEKFKLIKNVQAEWKAIGPVDKSQAELIWEQFRKPIDAYFEERKGKFEEEQKVRLENLQKKEELCAQALELSESRSWKETSEKLKGLQASWKEVGPAPREQDKEVWLKFRGACDNFFNSMKEHYKQLDEQRELNLRAKEDICFQAGLMAGLEESGDEQEGDASGQSWHEKSEIIRELQAKWKRIGPVPKSRSDELWDKFRRACDYVFEYARGEGEVDFEANFNAKSELCDEAERISRQVHTDSQIQKIKDLQRNWKSVGPVAPQDYAELWVRFKESCKKVFQEDERLHSEG